MAYDAHISIAGVSVFFPLYHGNSRSLKKSQKVRNQSKSIAFHRR